MIKEKAKQELYDAWYAAKRQAAGASNAAIAFWQKSEFSAVREAWQKHTTRDEKWGYYWDWYQRFMAEYDALLAAQKQAEDLELAAHKAYDPTNERHTRCAHCLREFV